MVMAAIICMTVAFALLLVMLFLLAREDAVIGGLVGFVTLSVWMALILYWLTHLGGAV